MRPSLLLKGRAVNRRLRASSPSDSTFRTGWMVVAALVVFTVALRAVFADHLPRPEPEERKLWTEKLS
jgi:hypothetical protein